METGRSNLCNRHSKRRDNVCNYDGYIPGNILLETASMRFTFVFALRREKQVLVEKRVE